MKDSHPLRGGRETGDTTNRAGIPEDWLVRFLLLRLRDGGSYAYRLEERLGELSPFEGVRSGEIYRALWWMEREGMVLCDREGGGFRLLQRRYEITEVGEAYLEFCADSLAERREEEIVETFFRLYNEAFGGQGVALVKGERTPTLPPRRLPPASSWWLIEKNGDGPMEVLTLSHGGGASLPVFSFREEAELFLSIGSWGDDWRVRERGAGELVSVLYGLCAGMRSLLDPLPEMVDEGTLGLVSLSRERLVNHIVGRIKMRPPPKPSERGHRAS